MSLRDLARNTLYRLLYSLTGLGQGVRVIPLYHSVGSETPHSIPLKAFQRQMEILAERFKVVRLCDLEKAMASEPSETNLACVTFDDGYQDNYEVALPILERAGIKGTFFIATDFLGKEFPTYAGECSMMTPAHVRELSALGHEIGAHTLSHPKLTGIPLDTARSEIEGSKRLLEGLVGKEIVSFAYPKGDHNQAIKGLIGSLGFRLAVTVQEGLVKHPPDWLALPRVWVGRKLNPRGFEAKMSPAVEAYEKLKRRWFLPFLRMG